MSDWLRHIFEGRPWWMNVLLAFCAYMAFFYMPWDLFWKPVAEDKEVWFGILFSGWGAKLVAIPHWFVYGAATYGFRRMRPWMCTWGAAYIAQISFGMLVWNINQLGGLTGVVVGVVTAAPFAGLAFVFWNAQEHFCADRVPLLERYGEWGLVTGASAGIGAEFARALARDGMSLVLVARREERLRELADQIEKEHSVATRVVAVDLAEADGADRVAEAVADLEISVLVNNAGFGYAGRFDKLELDRLRAQVQLNCLAPTVLTHRLLPGMRERGRGAVIFTGSVAGRQPLPLHGVYSASKAFALFLGEALWVELRGEGIDVLVLEPGSTETEFQAVAGEITHPGESAADVVDVAIDTLGHQPSVVSGWWNWLRANLVTRLLPRDLVASVAKDVIERQTPDAMR
ncbi:MAG: SDR family oxidoreductase [Proteobacteria bacterium]|nr:SDR family oxidoreductase [Pseudomonadota bacterium]